jgi:ATP-dependent RNA helicase RhlE
MLKRKNLKTIQDKFMSFDQLGLRVELLEAVKTKGYTAPTPIQAQAIPAILSGRDIFARAQTGTGKTDAFALPLVEILSHEINDSKKRPPRALVLTPTRELALQVGECIKSYARRVSLRCTVVYGGVRIEPQIDRVKRGIDILVATPGRLLDIAGKRNLDLSRIEFLVFDEADRMLDLGFSQEISAVLSLIPPDRRTMLFSATYTQDIRDLAEKVLIGPQHIEVTPGNTAAERIEQKIHMVDQNNKRALLAHLITRERWTRVLVFTRTRHGANRLAEKLVEQGISAAALHSSKSQSLRIRTLEQFKNGEIRTLVATDVAARGLDIINLPYVVNFDMPVVPEDYVHRIGRTGRAGVSGIALSLVSPNEKPYLKAIEKLLNHKIPVQKVDGFTEGCDVPDFVLFRPGSTTSQKKAAKEIKELVKERDALKQPKETPPKRAKVSKRKPAPESRAQARAVKPGAADVAGGKRTTGSVRKPESESRSRSVRPDETDKAGRSRTTSSRRKPEPESRSRSVKPGGPDKTGKTPSRPGSRPPKSSDNGRPKGGKQGAPGKQRKR